MIFFRQSGGREELRLFIHAWNFSPAGGGAARRLKTPAPRPDILLPFFNPRFQPGVHRRIAFGAASAVSPRSREAVKTAGLGCWSACPRLKPGVNENHEENFGSHPTGRRLPKAIVTRAGKQPCKKPLKVSLVKPTYSV
jgi:hypothetical protein